MTLFPHQGQGPAYLLGLMVCVWAAPRCGASPSRQEAQLWAEGTDSSLWGGMANISLFASCKLSLCPIKGETHRWTWTSQVAQR